MPTFCRHNRLIQNCPICSREQSIELRPVISSSAPRVAQPRTSSTGSARRAGSSTRTAPNLRVRQLARDLDDGYRSPLAPGLRSSADAQRLAEELAFAAGRLPILAAEPPGLYAEVADATGDLEDRTWLAFLIAYLSPLESDDPFASVCHVRRPWSEASQISLEGVQTGPRTAHDPDRGMRTLEAYRAWAQRAGTQAAAFRGDAAWSPERRFDRVFERLALPGFHRDARFELLVMLGRLGCYDLSAGRLMLVGTNTVTVAAKRVLGIGDSMLLERRAADLANGAGVPLDSLDLALLNWDRTADQTARITAGLGPGAEPDPELTAAIGAALGL